MDIYERINAGEYDNKLEYPAKPKKPVALSKLAKDLTDEEIRMIPLARAEHEDAVKQWRIECDKYNAETGRLTEKFYADLCDDFGVPPDNPFVSAIYGRAWQSGHSGGFGSVASEFSDLMPLWELYVKKGEE